jgi:phosphoribosylanthranilate isomerase
MTRVKICGITNLEDAMVAVEAGCDALGFVFAKGPRRVSVDEARAIIQSLPPFVKTVGLFVNEDPDVVREVAKICRLDLLQFHGDEDPEYCEGFDLRVIKAFRIKDKESLKRIMEYRNVAAYLLNGFSKDSYGGTGTGFNWDLVKGIKVGPIIVAGGLSPSNVKDAIRQLRPYGVDVSSGVESRPGKKDPKKIRDFIRMVREADQESLDFGR